jgi:hypothetical protein
MNVSAGDAGLVDYPDCLSDGLSTLCGGEKPNVVSEHFSDAQNSVGRVDPPFLDPPIGQGVDRAVQAIRIAHNFLGQKLLPFRPLVGHGTQRFQKLKAFPPLCSTSPS